MGSVNSKIYDAVIAFPLSHIDMKLGICIDGNKLTGIDFIINKWPLQAPVSSVAKRTARQLERYLKDPGSRFTLPLALSGTPFQIRVWNALLEIPSGQVLSYGRLAEQLNSSARAVGNACRHNPLPIIVPCHRVVSVRGLGGYMGKTKGMEVHIKQELLQHELVDE